MKRAVSSASPARTGHEIEGGAAGSESGPAGRPAFLRWMADAVVATLARSADFRAWFVERLRGRRELAADPKFRLGLAQLLTNEKLPNLIDVLASASTSEESTEHQAAERVGADALARLAPVIGGSEELQRQALDIVAESFRRSHGTRKALLKMLAPHGERDAKLFHDDLVQLGFDAFFRRPGHHYVPDWFGASADKMPDIRGLAGFGPIATEVVEQGTTLLYYDRLHTLYAALEDLRRRLGHRAGAIHFAEVGVYRGGTTWFLAAAARALGFETSQVHAFDTFSGHAAEDVRDGIDTAQVPGKFASTDLPVVRRYLETQEAVRLHVGRFQDTCAEVASERFGLVHADVDLYGPTLHLLRFFHERLIDGGAFVIDDWGSVSCPGVGAAVREFLEAAPGYGRIPLLTGQALLWKEPVR